MLSESLVGKALAKGLVSVRVHNLRDYAADKHHQADDKPFGGGAGMVLKVEPIYSAIKTLSGKKYGAKPYVLYLSPQGTVLNQKCAMDLSARQRIILLCGHYEGIDERAMRWIDAEISIGDYVLTGGELPAMVLIDSVMRMVPGVVKERSSVENDSFFKRGLDHSHYTRPEKFKRLAVPKVLLSGNHKAIAQWREINAAENTRKKRPDLLK